MSERVVFKKRTRKKAVRQRSVLVEAEAEEDNAQATPAAPTTTPEATTAPAVVGERTDTSGDTPAGASADAAAGAADGTDAPAPAPKSIREELEATRLAQKYRTRKGGVAIKQSGSFAVRTVGAGDSDEEEEERYGLQTSFTQTRNVDEVEKQMHAFIESKMAEKRQHAGGGGGGDTAGSGEGSEATPQHAALSDDTLYVIPENLQLPEKKKEEEGISESMLRGIVEIELPMEYRIANMERTEALRAKIKRGEKKRPNKRMLPANPKGVANFHFGRSGRVPHRIGKGSRAEAVDPKLAGHVGGKGKGGGGHKRRKGDDHATDAIVSKRFIKKFRGY